jgi:hypothetical protein
MPCKLHCHGPYRAGFYVSTCVNRWWTVRTAGQDGLWNAINNTLMFIGESTPRAPHLQHG